MDARMRMIEEVILTFKTQHQLKEKLVSKL